MSAAEISAPGQPLEWRARATAAPLITGGQRAVFASTEATAEMLLQTNWDFREVVYLPIESERLITATNRAQVLIRNPRMTAHSLAVETVSGEPTLLVIAQSYYHGWRGYVDGRRTPLHCANLGFQALEIPAGRHQVRLVYEDFAFVVGALISGLTLLICVGILALPNRARKLSRALAGS